MKTGQELSSLTARGNVRFRFNAGMAEGPGEESRAATMSVATIDNEQTGHHRVRRSLVPGLPP